MFHLSITLHPPVEYPTYPPGIPNTPSPCASGTRETTSRLLENIMYVITITYTSGSTDTFTVFSSSAEEAQSLIQPTEQVSSILTEEL